MKKYGVTNIPGSQNHLWQFSLSSLGPPSSMNKLHGRRMDHQLNASTKLLSKSTKINFSNIQFCIGQCQPAVASAYICLTETIVVQPACADSHQAAPGQPTEDAIQQSRVWTVIVNLRRRRAYNQIPRPVASTPIRHPGRISWGSCCQCRQCHRPTP